MCDSDWMVCCHNIAKQAIYCSGCHTATQEEDDQRTQSGKEVWRRQCGQQHTSTAGRRWRWQHRTQRKMENRWSVARVPPGVKRQTNYWHCQYNSAKSVSTTKMQAVTTAVKTWRRIKAYLLYLIKQYQ